MWPECRRRLPGGEGVARRLEGHSEIRMKQVWEGGLIQEGLFPAFSFHQAECGDVQSFCELTVCLGLKRQVSTGCEHSGERFSMEKASPFAEQSAKLRFAERKTAPRDLYLTRM